MKRWVPWALLAVSVALNIFVLAGFFWSRHAAYGFHDPAWRMAHASSYIADRLQLTPAQRTDLDRVMGEIRSRFEQARSTGADHPLLDRVLGENPDRAAIVAAIEERSQRMKQAMIEAVDISLPFLASLTPVQRAELKAIVKESRSRGPYGHRHGWFDD